MKYTKFQLPSSSDHSSPFRLKPHVIAFLILMLGTFFLVYVLGLVKLRTPDQPATTIKCEVPVQPPTDYSNGLEQKLLVIEQENSQLRERLKLANNSISILRRIKNLEKE